MQDVHNFVATVIDQHSSIRMASNAVVAIDIQGKLPKVASGKVRDLYALDDDTLLFVASDRISAYDVIMDNVSFRLPTSIISLLLSIFHSMFHTWSNTVHHIDRPRAFPEKAPS